MKFSYARDGSWCALSYTSRHQSCIRMAVRHIPSCLCLCTEIVEMIAALTATDGDQPEWQRRRHVVRWRNVQQPIGHGLWASFFLKTAHCTAYGIVLASTIG